MLSLLISAVGKDVLPPVVTRTLFVVGVASAAWQVRKFILLKRRIKAEEQAAIMADLQGIKKQIREHFKGEPRFIGVGIILNGSPQIEILVASGAAEEFREAMGDTIEGFHAVYVETKRPEAFAPA
jgi:hypothetical protein